MSESAARKLVITGARLIDPSSDIDEPRDLYLRGAVVEALERPGSFSELEDAEFVDASGLLLCPALVDIHVHLREPGFEWKETIETGGEAAVAGGYGSICCMPNTAPVNDAAPITESILGKAHAAKARIYPIGAITKGLKGAELAPMSELTDAGCVAFSDDGRAVQDALIMRRALEYSLAFGRVLALHEEDYSLSSSFAMNESALSLELGLRGMPGAAEDVMVARDIELVRITGASVHFCHVSTARSVELIRRAKDEGLSVSAESTPHHFTLTEEALRGYDPSAKMSPPLRAQEDVDAIVGGLRDGVIDCVASDHAPHDFESKDGEFSKAAFGTTGLQTTLALTLAKVREGCFSLSRAVEILSTSPAKCFKLEAGTLKKGARADFILVDLSAPFRLDAETNLSKSANSLFWEKDLIGRVVKTYVGGREVYSCR